ncbi:hypothetical protein T08_6964 [Trichinella sp. T8]|nr:hypothetical protein T08_6964 [Trichinella sp. T8]
MFFLVTQVRSCEGESRILLCACYSPSITFYNKAVIWYITILNYEF